MSFERRPILVLLTRLLLAGMVAASATTAFELIRSRAPLCERWGDGAWLANQAGVIGALALSAWALARSLRAAGQPLSGTAARMAFVCFSAASLSTWVWLQPYRPVDARVCFSLAAGLYALGLVCGPRLARALPQRFVHALDFAAFQLALAPFLAELALRAWRVAQPSALLDTGGKDVREWLLERRERPGSIRRGFRINADGFHDHDVAREPRPPHLVVCIGDSFSLGTVPHHRHYTTLCEAELAAQGLSGCEVYNVGVAGADPPAYEVMLEDYALPLAPDLVVIALFVGNDVIGSRSHHSSRPVRSWLDREGLLCYQLPRRLQVLASERAAGATIGERTPKRDSSGSNARPLGVAEIEAQMPWLDDALLEPPTLSRERFLAIEVERTENLCLNPPTAYPFLFERLESMRARCGEIPLAVLIIPDQFQVDDALWKEIQAALGGRQLDRDQAQRRITTWLESQGIAYVDLLPRLRALPALADGQIHAYHRTDTHFNARGNEVAARGLAELAAPFLDPARSNRAR